MQVSFYRAAILLGGLFMLTSQANAASMSYFLDQSNALPDGVNYLTVTIDDESDPGDINFSVVVNTSEFTPGSNFGMQTFSFNFDNSLSVTSSSIVDIDPSSWNISED
jgi:hypothetical protein